MINWCWFPQEQGGKRAFPRTRAHRFEDKLYRAQLYSRKHGLSELESLHLYRFLKRISFRTHRPWVKSVIFRLSLFQLRAYFIHFLNTAWALKWYLTKYNSVYNPLQDSEKLLNYSLLLGQATLKFSLSWASLSPDYLFLFTWQTPRPEPLAIEQVCVKSYFPAR